MYISAGCATPRLAVHACQALTTGCGAGCSNPITTMEARFTAQSAATMSPANYPDDALFFSIEVMRHREPNLCTTRRASCK